MTPRRTKIVATLGPSSSSPSVLEEMIHSGVDLVRHNFSHGTVEEHLKLVRRVRQIAARLDKAVGVIFDLQGPKLRIEDFKEERIVLDAGQSFTLDARCPANAGTTQRVGVAYKRLPRELRAGDTLLVDDGRIILEVERIRGDRVHCRVSRGGTLEGRKGINRVGGGLSARALTNKDRKDVRAVMTDPKAMPDYFALSFVRDADDVKKARKLVRDVDGRVRIIAKIERHEALNNIDEITQEADAIMIARGDLGVEIGDARLPGHQKMLIHKARSMNRAVITATQMMESMIHSPVPTRAEVFDVANAVLDGTDAVMLSGETAIGKYPAEVVQRMHNICHGAEQEPETRLSHHRIEQRFAPGAETIAMATMYAANHAPVRAILALTDTGATTLLLSRISSGIPIYAMTPYMETRQRVTLYRGVYPVAFSTRSKNHGMVVHQAIDKLKRVGLVDAGDHVLVTKGDIMGVAGGTSILQIAKVT